MSSHPISGLPALNTLVTKKTIIAVAAGVGIGYAFANIIRLFSKKTAERESTSVLVQDEGDVLSALETPSEMKRSTSGKGFRPTSSFGERPVSLRSSMRQNSQRSVSNNPIESDISNCQDLCIELRKTLEKAYSYLEMVKNRSSSDMERSVKVQGILNHIKQVEEAIKETLPKLHDIKDENFDGVGGYASSVRSRTLSVLSDDSFISAVEEFATEVDDVDLSNNVANLDRDELVFLKEGMDAALGGNVQYRKSRAEFCCCESETDFAAKLYCIRQAFEEIFKDEHKRLWLSKLGRSLLADFIRQLNQSPSKFFQAYDDMLDYVSSPENTNQLMEDIHSRGVVDVGFYDVVIDFIILDAFDDLKSPPSAIYSVLKNRFMSSGMKYSTLNSIVWSMIKTKRLRLSNPDGFYGKFYNISETVMPAITVGFLGTDERLGELCQYCKEQIVQLMVDIFNTQKVCYRSLEELTDDVWVVMRNRLESAQTRMSNELLPA